MAATASFRCKIQTRCIVSYDERREKRDFLMLSSILVFTFIAFLAGLASYKDGCAMTDEEKEAEVIER